MTSPGALGCAGREGICFFSSGLGGWRERGRGGGGEGRGGEGRRGEGWRGEKELLAFYPDLSKLVAIIQKMLMQRKHAHTQLHALDTNELLEISQAPPTSVGIQPTILVLR